MSNDSLSWPRGSCKHMDSTSQAKRLTMFTQIHLVSIRLDGSHNAGEGRHKLRSHPDVREFLGKHPLAKIVIVVDTHCLQETGGLIWEGAGPNVNACSLWEVGDGAA